MRSVAQEICSAQSSTGIWRAVGYDLYCKMLNEAVKEAKGMKQEESFDTTIDIDIDAYIPMGYIPNEVQKLDIYKTYCRYPDG